MADQSFHHRTYVLAATVCGFVALSGCEPTDVSTPSGGNLASERSEPADAQSISLPIDVVKVVRVRLAPFNSDSGVRLKRVVVDWKNVGTKPIRAVDANIILFGRRGRLEGGPRDYAIYAVSDDLPGVAPGETYTEPEEKGHVLDLELARAARRARVEITEVLETGAY